MMNTYSHTQETGLRQPSHFWGAGAWLVLAIGMALVGCEHREKVLDVEGPNGGGFEVDKTTAPDGSKGLEFRTDD